MTGSVVRGAGVGQPLTYAMALTAGALFGLAATAVTTIALCGRTNGAAQSLAMRAMTNVGVATGAALLANAATGGQIGEMLYQDLWGQRHQFGFALRHGLQPGIVVEARHAYVDATDLQVDRWGPKQHVDDGIDAIRHSYAAGLLASRLVVDRGVSADVARSVVADIGHAHELDGLDNTSGGSARMDEHNNHVGARIGAQLATATATGSRPATTEVLAGVLKAVAEGELVVLDHGVARATTAADVPPEVVS